MTNKSGKELRESADKQKEESQIKEILPKELKPATVAIEEGAFEKVITINRTAKVTKGGKKLGFSALVVIGDRKGHVGCGFGKANEVSDSIKKALSDARKSTFEVQLKGSTIPHEVMGEFGAGKVFLKPASEGTGVRAGGATRAICEAAGIKDILAKCLGSNNPFNIVKATVAGLKSIKDKNEVRQLSNEETS